MAKVQRRYARLSSGERSLACILTTHDRCCPMQISILARRNSARPTRPILVATVAPGREGLHSASCSYRGIDRSRYNTPSEKLLFLPSEMPINGLAWPCLFTFQIRSTRTRRERCESGTTRKIIVQRANKTKHPWKLPTATEALIEDLRRPPTSTTSTRLQNSRYSSYDGSLA